MNKVIEKQTNQLIGEIMMGALQGRNAHLCPEKALEGLKVDITGKKILNTPYTIWQLLKHMHYWQCKLLQRLRGEMVAPDHTWQEGWEETYNARDQEELEIEIGRFISKIREAEGMVKIMDPANFCPEGSFQTHYHVLQAMASHISYHLAEIVILRRIFGAWPPPSGGLTW